MKCEIILTNLRSTWNKFEWDGNTLLYVGKIIVGDSFISDGSEPYRLFRDWDVLDKRCVETRLASIDGFFSIIFENEEVIWVIGDRVRSYPLFFARNEETVFVSDSARAIKEHCHLDKQNDVGVLEFLLCGYVTGNETLYEGLSQLLPGQYLLFDKKSGNIVVDDYFRYYPAKGDETSLDKQGKLKEYQALMRSSFDRLGNLITREGYQPVVPLSGGRDSRLMAVLLKEQGFDQTICFTFGTEGHPEVIKSQAIAKALGFEWWFAPYTREKWHREYHSSTLEQFIEFSDGLAVRPHLMEFIAVKELFCGRDKKYLFLPGHSLDFIAGGHIPPSLMSVRSPTPRDLYTAIMSKHFSFHHIYLKERQVIIKRLHNALEIISCVSRADLIRAFEYWDWRERQGKLILNALNVYEFFDFDWYVPFWETSWMDFFSSLPYQWRYKQNFHKWVLSAFYPDYFKEETWVTGESSIVWEVINLVRKSPLTECLILYFNKIRKRNYYSLSRNYGLERYGAFDLGAKTLEEFSRRYASCTDVKRIFYFFTIDYLIRNGFCLDFLDARYKKAALCLPGC
jgi:asparagine synthase (glutamine-hydrolysing)